MNAFEVVTIVVSVLAITLALTTYFRVSRVLEELGQRGLSWYHADEQRPDEQPSEDERDAPLPKRPIRGRPE